jgi:hypothetical protein
MILVRGSNVFANSAADDLIFQSLEMSQIVSDRSPGIIESKKTDRMYLKKDRISPVDQGAYLFFDDGQIMYFPRGFVLLDDEGYFLPTSYGLLAKKPFKNVCLDCKYEWEGGVFTWRCPKCFSTNIVNIPNK